MSFSVIIDSTDKKRIGEIIDPNSNPIVFKDGQTLSVSFVLHNKTVIGNSNYVIVLTPQE